VIHELPERKKYIKKKNRKEGGWGKGIKEKGMIF
jgi:hypothetical protein